MDVQIDTEAGRGRRDEIYRQIRAAVLDGRLRAGEALPPSRELAQRLAVSRNTVSAAYDRLTAEGFLVTRVGAGTFVRAGATGAEAEGKPDPLRPLAEWDEVPAPPVLSHARPRYDFRVGIPDVSLFPFGTWRRLSAGELRGSDPDILGYGNPAGHSGLRAAIARHIGVSRDVRVTGEDVVVTNGAQQALDLLTRVLLRPGDRVALEDPGYPPPRRLLGALGVHPVAVRLDEEGLVVSEIPDGTRAVYVTPSHQFPLGMSMSLSRRLELIEWARRHDAVIVEDDYDTEFRYTGRPLEPLHSLDESGRVVYIGSFSKVLLPALRLGFVVAPRSLRAALVKAKHLSDWQTNGPVQATLARFIEDGSFAKHVRRARREYRARHDRLAEALVGEFADLGTPVPAQAGLHVSVLTERPTGNLVRAARELDVALFSLGGFGMRREGPRGFVLGYGAVQLADIEPGLRRLRAASSK
ncbi:transcriptional regulator, GntR family [Amycolatopsis marina]|uniref:Transcriptional regulator, GntR family n=1 Tax=Amycolatopsis marina TaxID=490629 RepID=A0A1I1CED4_9PSEU|nr:PLP-dependent aminotransferase family protein [Amycolatopsis marina]SFB60432.1 transcriptional regulator, GntR family [Amycolatopsis marina]